jgi:inner membrane protein
MLILGHIGITLGTAALLHEAINRNRSHCTRLPKVLLAPNPISAHKESCLSSLANHIDIRILLVGSLLPDIIDKPVGQLIFRDTFANGRIFCHTLLFLLIISLAGIYLYQRRRKNWLLVLSFGTFTHIILDQMWLAPETLLWPLYGFTFPKANLSHWLGNILVSLLAAPSTYIPEIIGAVVLGIFLWQLIHLRTLGNFVIKGTVSKARS